MSFPPFEPLSTQRLHIRPVVKADLADLFEVNGDALVTQFLPYATWQTPEDAGSWLARMQALAEAGTGLQLVMARRADHKVIGTVLLFKFDGPSARVELGYVLGRAFWRQGYAKEALQAVCLQAFQHMGMRRIEAEVNVDNLASNALLHALGFLREGHLRRRWVNKAVAYDTYLHAALADEWLLQASKPALAISLRAAAPEDALCLSVLAMQVFLDTYATQGIRPAIAREVLAACSESVFLDAAMQPQTRLVVAEVQGHLVGFAQVSLGASHALAPAGAPAELFKLYVQEPFTAARVGTRLLARAEQLAQEAGAAVMWLTPWVHNYRALGFYGRRGYEDLGLTYFAFEGESHENRVYAKCICPQGKGTPGRRVGSGA